MQIRRGGRGGRGHRESGNRRGRCPRRGRGRRAGSKHLTGPSWRRRQPRLLRAERPLGARAPEPVGLAHNRRHIGLPITAWCRTSPGADGLRRPVGNRGGRADHDGRGVCSRAVHDQQPCDGWLGDGDGGGPRAAVARAVRSQRNSHLRDVGEQGCGQVSPTSPPRPVVKGPLGGPAPTPRRPDSAVLPVSIQVSLTMGDPFKPTLSCGSTPPSGCLGTGDPRFESAHPDATPSQDSNATPLPGWRSWFIDAMCVVGGAMWCPGLSRQEPPPPAPDGGRSPRPAAPWSRLGQPRPRRRARSGRPPPGRGRPARRPPCCPRR